MDLAFFAKPYQSRFRQAFDEHVLDVQGLPFPRNISEMILISLFVVFVVSITEASPVTVKFSDLPQSLKPTSALSPFDMDKCQFNTVMCCYTKSDKKGNQGPKSGNNFNKHGEYRAPADNTDVCFEPKRDYHCHGFYYTDDKNDPNRELRDDLLNFVNKVDHFGQRGYFGHVDGYPKCGCIENMPVVTKSDCTQIKVDKKGKAKLKNGKPEFVECKGPNNKNNNQIRGQIERVEAKNPKSKGMQLLKNNHNLVLKCENFKPYI